MKKRQAHSDIGPKTKIRKLLPVNRGEDGKPLRRRNYNCSSLYSIHLILANVLREIRDYQKEEDLVFSRSAFHAKRVTVMRRDLSHIRDIIHIYNPASFFAVTPKEYQGKKRAVPGTPPAPPNPPPSSQSPSPPPGRPHKHNYPKLTGTVPQYNERLRKRATRM